MVVIRWKVGSLWQRLKLKGAAEWFFFKLSFWSLFYNQLTSWNTCIDTGLEPLFWFVDHFIKYLGPAFVVIVVCLTLSIVLIFYVCLLPFKYDESYFWTAYHLIFGHWLLANIVFHYFKAVFTDPGHPPEKVPEVVSICKKCISPKPPRSHHCSVCNTCILKMDHHCPWLNNCVGNENHRYFFLFCVYMWVGTVYVSISAYPVFKEHFIGTTDIGFSGYFYPLHIVISKLKGLYQAEVEKNNGSFPLLVVPTRSPAGFHFHGFILYEFLMCSAVSVALGALTLWHANLIQRGETSIEVHINKKEKQRLKKKGLVFRNPYSFGVWQNWKIFLGLTHGRTFWRHVLLPSSHRPDDNGLRWKLSTAIDPAILML